LSQFKRGTTADFVIIGGCSVGIGVAREMKSRYPDQKVVVLEGQGSLTHDRQRHPNRMWPQQGPSLSLGPVMFEVVSE
jgi:uncharacterized NAD-dependent epimerase/dehydratase family protein